MLLSELLQKAQDEDFEVTHVTDDSRQTKAGSVFVWDSRIMPDGEKFIAQAIGNGAIAISDIEAKGAIFCAEPAQILVRWAKHKHPTQPSKIVGVTGTNGKTSIAWFFQQLTGGVSIGTLGVVQNNEVLEETGYTSPTALKLHKILNNLPANKPVCVEISSHALALNRADGVSFTAAALTNVTQDHLDFHGTMENYVLAKQRLFSELLPENSTAILPAQHPIAWPFISLCKQMEINVITTGTANAELVVKPLKMTKNGMLVKIAYNGVRSEVPLQLVGGFQAENLAISLTLAIMVGEKIEDLISKLGNLTPVPGRMELIENKNKKLPTVVVDYAHTPDALEKAIKALLPLRPKNGKLVVVFGAGGDRDDKKRKIMGQTSAELADSSIITDDNPRTENADKIRKEISTGAKNERIIGDRGKAIAYAIENFGKDDIILIAGKGHETGQIVGTKTLPHNDKLLAKQILENI